ncbi:carbamoyl-phosphate synthase [Rossellomorea aquimaris]|uniref:Putative ATP-grasp superfamily ATP-dependent carboligase n=1 Tax=Rossellomorea aquimaris TaxID=189382 RepID=A0A366EZJ4_9BACI|nr:carbamoyl-phosphate synthase [Rossellomorea aquimaris]RBP07831.1 putative ATP-grasp superfamily ATP-dependent carboligase [Rossellomorea aquimaris]
MLSSHPAVVLDLSANGVGIIHALSRKGIDVYAFDTEGPYSKGKSRLATCGVCPSPLNQEAELLSFLKGIAMNLDKKPVLYAGADDYVVFISKYRDELSQYYLFLYPDHSLILDLLDKKKTYELALEYNIPTAKTFFVESDEQLDEAITQLEFPCILKPVFGHEFRKHVNKKAIHIQDAIQLRRIYPIYRKFGELIIQEIIPGDNQCFYKVATFFDEDMELLALFTLQKNHQFPAQFGTGAHIVSKRIPDLVDVGVPLLKELGIKGVSMIEYKKDPRDGQYKLIEINPRFWLTHSLTGHSGVDFALQYYQYLTGQRPSPKLQQIDGVQWIYLVRYFLTFLEKRKNGEMSLKDFFYGFRGKKVFALLAFDDPMPFIRSTLSHLRNAWKRKRRSD